MAVFKLPMRIETYQGIALVAVYTGYSVFKRVAPILDNLIASTEQPETANVLYKCILG